MAQVPRWAVPAGMVIALSIGWPSRAGQLIRIDLPTIAAYEASLSVFVAEAAGFFQREGVEIGRLILTGGTSIRNILISGQLPVGVLGTDQIPLARVHGAPLKAVAATYDRPITAVVVRAQLRSQVRSVADLKGRRVGITTPGSYTWSMIVTYLRRAGLDPDRDVQVVSLGTADPGVLYTALQTGRVDAVGTSEPVLTRAETDGVAFVLVNPFETEVARRWMGSDRAMTGVLAATEGVIRSSPELVGAMVRAIQNGLEYIRTHSDEELVRLVLSNSKSGQLFQGIEPELAARMIRRIRSGYGTGCLSRSAYEVELRRMLETGLLKEAVSFEEATEPRWVGVCD